MLAEMVTPDNSASGSASLRALPSVDQLLRTAEAVTLGNLLGTSRVAALARLITDDLRRELQEQKPTGKDFQSETPTRESLLVEAVRRLHAAADQERLAGVRRVINATGVIIHTNLGRAPLSEAARSAILEAAGYCGLEYDRSSGARGRRGARVEDLLIELTGAEDALVVNNCAAAALLILTVLASDGETLISRGELVEIGGDFRVPDVLAASGSRMIEVGTTNRTKLADYQHALNERTRLIMRVHQSNFRIVGFTSAPTLAELSSLAHEVNLPLYEDAGSGVLQDLGPFEVTDEPIIRRSIASGADVVSFSGDKLLGACQAGLIVGRSEIVGRLRKHPLFRALRADKLSLAALEATLESHRRGSSLIEVPVLKMLSQSLAEIARRTTSLIEGYRQAQPDGLELTAIDGLSAIGGGSAPNTQPRTVLLAITDRNRSADDLAKALRLADPPVISRIADDRVLLDLRTVAAGEEAELLQTLLTISDKNSRPRGLA